MRAQPSRAGLSIAIDRSQGRQGPRHGRRIVTVHRSRHLGRVLTDPLAQQPQVRGQVRCARRPRQAALHHRAIARKLPPYVFQKLLAAQRRQVLFQLVFRDALKQRIHRRKLFHVGSLGKQQPFGKQLLEQLLGALGFGIDVKRQVCVGTQPRPQRRPAAIAQRIDVPRGLLCAGA